MAAVRMSMLMIRALSIVFLCSQAVPALANAGAAGSPRVPVILTLDIGDDIDDSWALVMMLRSPELDVKLILTDHGKVEFRAKLIAKFLEIAGRTDIPIGLGVGERSGVGRQAAWVEGYDLSRYPGTIHEDGVGAMIDTIMSSPTPVTVLCIGPVPDIAEALQREPRITGNARFVGMHGSVRRGYHGRDKPQPEYNVKANAPACRAAFQADWNITITPLDTCGIVVLDGEHYQAIYQSTDPLLQALIENYRIWTQGRTEPVKTRSSTLFDTVAVYLAFAEDLLVIEELPIAVADDGMTRIDEADGRTLRVATEWKDLPAFKDLLVKRLTGERVPPILTVERSDAGKAYLAWGGKPLLAYGPGDEMRLLSGAADVERWARWQRDNGMNLLRGYPASVPIDAYGAPGLHPFRRQGDKWNVEDWNDEYFANMAKVIARLEEHGIFLHLQLWQIVWFKDGPTRWQINYLNPANNVNEWTRGYAKGHHYLAAPSGTTGHAHRKQWVMRVLDTIKGRRHVWVDMINELGGVPGTDLAWAREVATWVKEWERANGQRLLIGVDSEHHYRPDQFGPFRGDFDLIMFNELNTASHAREAIGHFRMPAVSVRSSDGRNQPADYLFARPDQASREHQTRYRTLCYRSIFAGLQGIGAYWKPMVADADYRDMTSWAQSARALRGFWDRVSAHWPDLNADPSVIAEAVTPHAHAMVSDVLSCAYLECGPHAADRAFDASSLKLRCPYPSFRVELFHPHSGETAGVQATREGDILAIPLPAFTDDLVVMVWKLPGTD